MLLNKRSDGMLWNMDEHGPFIDDLQLIYYDLSIQNMVKSVATYVKLRRYGCFPKWEYYVHHLSYPSNNRHFHYEPSIVSPILGNHQIGISTINYSLPSYACQYQSTQLSRGLTLYGMENPTLADILRYVEAEKMM